MVKISDIIDVLKKTEYSFVDTEDLFAYYDREKNEFYLFTSYDESIFEGISQNEDRLLELIEKEEKMKLLYTIKNDETNRYVFLKNPLTKAKLAYSFIALFTKDRNVYPKLNHAFSGHSKFARLKKTLAELNLLDQYYLFIHRNLKDIALKWCLKNNIEYLDEKKN